MIAAGSRICKLVGNFGPASEFLALNPNLILIGRLPLPFTAESQYSAGQVAELAARKLVDFSKDQYRLNPLIKIWEGHNEPVWIDAKAMAWYARFEAERLRLLADLGLRGVIGCFSTGNPDFALWPAFGPALQAAKQYHGILGLHEYSSPWLWWMTGRYQKKIGDDVGPVGFTTLRYRIVQRDYLTPNGLGDLPIAITEAGCDRVNDVRPGMAVGAWKFLTNYWQTQSGEDDPIPYWRGPERDPEKYYAEQLAWYDRQLQADSNVLGATIFTVGTDNAAWVGHDIAGTRVARYVIDYIRANATQPDPDPSTPPDTNPPPENHPMPPYIKNPSFESRNWTTNLAGNQDPEFWHAHDYINETPRFASKMQQGHSVPATVPIGPEERVHKGPQLGVGIPANEVAGQPHAIVINGLITLKEFAGGNPGVFASDLYQDILGVAGQRVTYVVPVLGESPDVPNSPTGQLEPDHFRVRVTLGDPNGPLDPAAMDSRIYADMIQHKDIQGNDRNWNLFQVSAVFPANGILRLNIYKQQNWPGKVDFFIDDIRESIGGPVTPPPDTEPDNAQLKADLLVATGNLESALAALKARINAI